MVDAVATGQAAAVRRPQMDAEPNTLAIVLFVGLLAAGVLFAVYSLQTDIAQSGMPFKTWAPFLLLGVALLIALGFEFVNGFHDTANAVATVIYTHSMPAHVAVVWSGCFNFLGVLVSSGAVAFGIISLLAVELILQVGTGAGFAMVFARLRPYLGPWLPVGLDFPLPPRTHGSARSSASALPMALMRGLDGISGVDWSKATEIGYSLLLSPIFGFCMAAVLLPLLK